MNQQQRTRCCGDAISLAGVNLPEASESEPGIIHDANQRGAASVILDAKHLCAANTTSEVAQPGARQKISGTGISSDA